MPTAASPRPPRWHINPLGPWPFVTHYSAVKGDEHVFWGARQLRTGMRRHVHVRLFGGQVPVWRSRGYNRVLATNFAVGALLFMVGAFFSLMPTRDLPVPPGWINLIFFAGSVPFTIGAYLQLFQAANILPLAEPTGDAPSGFGTRPAIIGWRPKNAGWLSSFFQFLGTIHFNFNTYNAIAAPSGWYQQDIDIWVPGMVGSVLFVISGYLSYVETSGAYWSWKPRDLDWKIVSVNFLGCIFFLTASALAFVPKGPELAWIPAMANLHLFLGGACFLIGSLLTIHESRTAQTTTELPE